MTDPATPLLEARAISKSFAQTRALVDAQSQPASRASPTPCSARTARASRRCRGSSRAMSAATAGEIVYRGQPLDVAQPARGARRRHRHGDAGDEPRARPLRPREHFPSRSRPAGAAVAARHAAAGERDPRRSRPGARAAARSGGARSLRGPAPARRDRQGARAQSQSHHFRRADRLPEPERSRAPVRRDRADSKARNARSSSSRTGSRKCSRSPTRSRSCARAARSRPRGRPASLNQTELMRLMVGRDIGSIYAASAAPPSNARRARAVRARACARRRWCATCPSTCIAARFSGLGGLVGAGRSETVETLFGLRPRAGGEVRFEGRPFAPRAPAEAIRAGHRICRRGSSAAVDRAGPVGARESAARPSRRASRLRPRLWQAGPQDRTN